MFTKDEMNNKSTENKICDNCAKKDVCMYRTALERAVTDINTISGRSDVFIETHIKCIHWLSEHTVSIR
jgi:hypothetical protein